MMIGGYDLPLGRRTLIMGILNITPDSFSDGGMYLDPGAAVEKAALLVDEGADIIDIGGESSRPGSSRVSAREEAARVIPVIKRLSGKIKAPISIDTYKSEVAARALDEGALMVNDITALRGDRRMPGTIARENAWIVLMHMKGTPANMQKAPEYGDVIAEIREFLLGAITMAEKSGISPDHIMVDPGIGFGKTPGHNFEILRRLDEFRSVSKRMVIGPSRKSFVGSVTGRAPEERIFGTAAAVALAVAGGADVVRVHDVAQMRDVVKVADAIRGKN
ncbi:MAG: dihydropteroate synthase [Candidatus Omnitrophica bacterium]|jgi:dihydropteroate synthase|nr:dihydropteroate synthase [Candidatus Omnitrophota bacterium]